jgi:prepilin peptidase CpaA
VASGVVGGLIALVMMLRSGAFLGHLIQLQSLSNEIITVRNPVLLHEKALSRKSKMLLLPYAIPIAIGSIGYFAWMRMFF